MEQEEILRRFGFYKQSPTEFEPGSSGSDHASIRHLFIQFAAMLNAALPEGREKALAFTELETASMWAHKSVASQAELVRETDGTDYESMLPLPKRVPSVFGPDGHLAPLHKLYTQEEAEAKIDEAEAKLQSLLYDEPSTPLPGALFDNGPTAGRGVVS